MNTARARAATGGAKEGRPRRGDEDNRLCNVAATDAQDHCSYSGPRACRCWLGMLLVPSVGTLCCSSVPETRSFSGENEETHWFSECVGLFEALQQHIPDHCHANTHYSLGKKLQPLLCAFTMQHGLRHVALQTRARTKL